MSELDPIVEELKEQLEALRTLVFVKNKEINKSLDLFAADRLPDKIKAEIINHESFEDTLKQLVNEAIADKECIIEQMRTLSKTNHDLKKENAKLRLETHRIHNEFNTLMRHCREMLEATEQAFDRVEKAIDHGRQMTALGFQEIFKYLLSKDPNAKFFEDGDNPYANQKPREIIVKAKDLENQGEFVKEKDPIFNYHVFRDRVDKLSLSERGLANLLGIPRSSLKRIKGRIQDYIAEKHPDKPVYIPVRLKEYYDNGNDFVGYLPLDNLFFNIPQKVKPWDTITRQAILNGTATIE